MALKDIVTSYWKLDEGAGATRKDSVGAADLLDDNAVGSADGKRGAAARFVRTSENHLEVSDRAAVSMGDVDFAAWAWFKMVSTPAGVNYVVLAKGPLADNARTEYALTVDDGPPPTLRAYVGNGAAFASFPASTFGTLSPDVWYFGLMWHDATNNQVGVGVNGTYDVSSYAGGVQDGNESLVVGSDGVTGVRWFDGLIDEVGISKGAFPSAAERAQLYGAGDGLSWPFLTTVGELSHGADEVVAKLIWSHLLLGSDPAPWEAFAFGRGTRPTTTWPVFVGNEPHEPMNVITVVETTPQEDAVIHVTGEVQQHDGFTVRVRAGGASARGTARTRATRLAAALTQLVKDSDVVLDGTTYRVVSVPRASVVRVGPGQTGQGTSGYVYTINCLASIMKHPIPGQT